MEDVIITWAIQGGNALRSIYPSSIPGPVLLAVPLFLVGVLAIASRR
jgi:hypothetical protein